jgi:hypothetical protein
MLNHTRPKVLVARYTDTLVGALRRFTARLHAQACAYERQCEAQPRQGGLRSLTRTCCSRLHPTRLPPAAPRTHRHMLCTAVRQDTYGTRAPWSAQLGRTAAARAGSSVGAEASQTTGSRDVYVLSLGHVCALSLARLRVVFGTFARCLWHVCALSLARLRVVFGTFACCSEDAEPSRLLAVLRKARTGTTSRGRTILGEYPFVPLAQNRRSSSFRKGP